MSKDHQTLRNELGSLAAVDAKDPTDDNLAIALATYFEARIDRPEDDEIDEDLSWSKWAIERTNDLLDRIIKHLLNQKDDNA